MLRIPRNVTTIVPLRPYSSKANILPEQTLGRGLRRITPPGQAHEVVTVVEHPAFASLYQQELAQEGLPIEIVDVDDVPSTTISIYPDHERKDVKKLEISLPRLSSGHRIIPKVEGLTFEDVKKEFGKYRPLPLGGRGKTEIDYEGRHLFTGEVVERMKINLPLLASGVGAVSYFVRQLESICRLRGLHAALAPLIRTFLEEVLFEKRADLFDPALAGRLGDSDVGEHLRAVFVPLIRARTTTTEKRLPEAEPVSLSAWKAFQVTHSERRPALEAKRTLFNLVTCDRELEVAMAQYAERAPDVAAFAKNAGPQCLRIDYLTDAGRIAFYTPDFFVRALDGLHYLVETKGRVDRDVPRKARAAVEWCRSASQPVPARQTGKRKVKWEYLYVPQGVFERLRGDRLDELARTCAPSLQELLGEEDLKAQMPLFAAQIGAEEEPKSDVAGFVDSAVLESFPPRYRKAVEQAVMLFRFFENKEGMSYSPVFNALLGSVDEAARGLILRKLLPELPKTVEAQKDWFSPYLYGVVEKKDEKYFQNMAYNLKKTLVFKNGISPLGLLRSCLDFALNRHEKVGGVFEVVRLKFKQKGGRDVLAMAESINDFRNRCVAHQEKELTDAVLAQKELRRWIEGLGLFGAWD